MKPTIETRLKRMAINVLASAVVSAWILGMWMRVDGRRWDGGR